MRVQPAEVYRVGLSALLDPGEPRRIIGQGPFR